MNAKLLLSSTDAFLFFEVLILLRLELLALS